MVKKTNTGKKPVAKKTRSVTKKTVQTKSVKNTNYIKKLTTIFLAINLILILYIAFFKKDALSLEQMKVGGKENYKLMKQLYNNENFKQQQNMSLTQILSEIDGGTTSNNLSKELDEETLASIMQDTYISGKQDARFVIVEYSDFTCGFCHRQHEERNIQRVVEKYPNDVAHIFKNMPRGTTVGAEAAECAGKIGGAKSFYTFVDKLFAQGDISNSAISAAAKESGLNENTLLKCVNDGDTKGIVNKASQEFSSVFGFSGTPGTAIIDRETGKYVVIAGAYPFETFDAEMQNMLNN